MEVAFNKIGLGVIGYLESLPDVQSVKFSSNPGIVSHEFSIFQKRHNVILPEDIKSFYSLFNGFSICWSVEMNGKLITVGDMRVNKFEEVVAAPIIESQPMDNSMGLRLKRLDAPDSRNCVAFVIDSHSDVGAVYLVYRLHGNISVADRLDPLCNTEIWLQDMSLRWFFICSTFTQYLRLVVLHLGIFGWQLAYVPEGLPLSTSQWMDIFCKDRLCVNLHQKEQCGSEIR